jgi:hypothetical protein
MRATCPPWFHHSDDTWRRVKVTRMKLLIVQLSPTSCNFIPLWTKYSFQHPQSTFFLNVRDQVSHPYKTTGKIIVPYILIFTFFESSWKEKKVLDWLVTSITQIQSALNFPLNQIWFVSIVPKYYLNHATFWNDLLAIFMSWLCLEFWWRDYFSLRLFQDQSPY